MRFMRWGAAAGCAIALCVQAQQDVTMASVSGHVTDPSGALVVNAHVVAKNLETNRVTAVDTDPQGRLRFQFLPPGRYEIVASSAGFWPAVRVVDLQVGAAVDLSFVLTLPSVNVGDTVYAVEHPIETERSQVSETVLQEEVQQLPFEGRNFLDLALLLPGVSPTNTASTQTLAETSEVVGQGYSINSQRNFSNSFVVDGLSANDDAAGVAGNVFSMDAVREFQVVTIGGQAEFGRALGGYFNVVTRSGTNALSGTVYGFLRNQRMNAANALSQSKLLLTQGIYGASLSGPLKKDQTFAFGNFEEGRLNTEGVIAVSAVNAAAINARLIATGYAAPLLPVSSGPTTQYPTTLHTDTAFARLDHEQGSRGQFTARYSLYELSSRNARGVGGLNEVSNGTSVFDVNHTLAVSEVLTLTPKLLNETRAQFSYDSLNAPPNDQVGPAVTISGVAVFGRSTSSPTARLNRLAEAVDNLALDRGAHALKFGVDVLNNSDAITFPQSLRGSYSFGCLYDNASEAPAGYTGNFCANSLYSGRYNTQGFTQNFGSPVVQQNNPNLGLYAQDAWKISRQLTLNAGVRWDAEWLDTIRTDWNNVSPRMGVAWSPFASGTTVVRGSFGLFYDRVPLRPLANALLSANNTSDLAQVRFASYTFSPTDAGAPVFPGVASAPPAGAKLNFSLMDRGVRNPYSVQAGLEVEQQLAARTSVGLSYQHVRGEHLIGVINANINPDGTRPDATRGNVKVYSGAFASQYDGLSASLLQRPVRWGSVRVSYTWSHALDDVGEFFFSAPINNFDPREDWARSDDDQRHRFVVDAVVHTPMSAGHGWLEQAMYGWQLSGVVQSYSALPYNVVTGGNTKQGTTQRPCVTGYSLSGTNPCTEGLRGAVIGRNAGKGFGFLGMNARLSRTFLLPHELKLEAAAEAFNALNHRNNMIPNATLGGSATAVGDPRNVQLALRLRF